MVKLFSDRFPSSPATEEQKNPGEQQISGEQKNLGEQQNPGGQRNCRNNVNSPVRTSAIGLLQHLRLLYLPSELDITKYTHNEFTYYLIAIKPQTL
jgi:hypothetical protein